MEQADNPGLWPEPNTVEVRLRQILTGLSVGICQAYDLFTKIFYPLFMDNVKVDPDFEQTILEGELFLKGRLRIVSAVRIAWRLFRDKNVRYVYRKLNRQ